MRVRENLRENLPVVWTQVCLRDEASNNRMQEPTALLCKEALSGAGHRPSSLLPGQFAPILPPFSPIPEACAFPAPWLHGFLPRYIALLPTVQRPLRQMLTQDDGRAVHVYLTRGKQSHCAFRRGRARVGNEGFRVRA